MTASELKPGDAVKLLIGGLAHVCEIRDLGDGLLSVEAEVNINLRHDDVVMLFNRNPEPTEA